jgi:hypothetical protein
MKNLNLWIGLAVMGLFVAVGCEGVASKGVSAGNEPIDQPAPSELNNFPGGYLTVEIDGNRTTEARKENHEQIWVVGEMNASPTLRFAMDEKALGEMKSVSVVIQPVKDGRVVEGDLFQYAGGKKLLPGEPIQLDLFTHVHDGKMETDIKALPKGQYRISVQVHGEKNWDRQQIDAAVK